MTVSDSGLVQTAALQFGFDANGGGYVHMGVGGVLAVQGNKTLGTPFVAGAGNLFTIQGGGSFGEIRYNPSGTWVNMTGATEGVDYTLEYYATGGPTINGQDLTGYTVLTMGPFGPTLEIADNSVDENPAPGAAAGPLSVANTNATFTYSLVDGEGDSGNDYFTLDGSGPNNSNLLTDAVFDYETTNSYSIRVLAEQDGGGLSLTNKLTIDITDVVGEDGGFMYARGEVATDRTLVGTLEAELADGDSSVTYTRDAATYHGAMFQISDATNLVLNVAARPARARPHVGQAGSQPPSRFPLRSTSSQWPLLADPTRCSNPLLFRIARLLSIDVVLIPVAVAIARLDIRGFAPINCSIFC